MPRPSLKTVRREEILEAFAFCAARFGLEGATQERIADRAGVKRSILRHYLGNRDEMTDALIDYMAVQFDEETEALRLALPETGRVEALTRPPSTRIWPVRASFSTRPWATWG